MSLSESDMQQEEEFSDESDNLKLEKSCDFLYVCEYCSIGFRKNAKYIRHLRTHTKEKPFICTYPDCGKSFSRNDHLTRHMTTHTEKFDYSCTFDGCNKKFKSQYNLNRHLKKHEHCSETDIVRYKCSYCEESFSKKLQLRKHEYIHTGIKPFRCNIPGCSKSYMTSSQLSSHEIKHQSDSVFVCSFKGCTFTTTSIVDFKKHLKENHIIPPPDAIGARYPCSISGCSQTFASKQTLNVHLKTFHNRVKYQCEFCNRVYSQLPSLSRHRRIHKGNAEQEAKKRKVLLSLTGRPSKDLQPVDDDIEEMGKDCDGKVEESISDLSEFDSIYSVYFNKHFMEDVKL